MKEGKKMKKIVFCFALSCALSFLMSCVSEDGFYYGPYLTDRYGNPLSFSEQEDLAGNNE